MSSHQTNMAQKLWNTLQRYGIVAPATSTPSMQNTGVDIPQGIPALFEFSRRHRKTSALDRIMTKLSLARHFASTPEVRLAAVACGLLYLSRSFIGPILSSIGDEMNQELREWIFPNSATVSMTAAELQQMHEFADRVQVRLDEYERIQSDMLNEYGNMEDEVDRLTQQAGDDAAHSDARIRGLETQIEVEKDSRARFWQERERYRLGGKAVKEDLDKLQKEYNDLEDDRDEWKEKAEERQTSLVNMTTTRDNLQASVGRLETDKADLRAEIAALKEQLEAQSTVMHGTNDDKEQSGAADAGRQDGDDASTDVKTSSQAIPDEQDQIRDVQLETSEESQAEAPADRKNTRRVSFDEMYDASDRGDNAGENRAGSEDDEDIFDDDDFANKPSYGQRFMSRMNASASEIPPSGYNFVVAPPESPVSSAQSPVQSPFAAHSPHQPAPKAAGPGQVRNAHIRALNAEVMSKEWRRRSGMPDRDEEVVLAPEDELEIEGMFQRQIIQAYTPMLAFSTFPPSFTDILDAPEMRAARRTISPALSQAREDIPSAEASEESDNPVDPPKNVATTPSSGGNSSDNLGADEDAQSEGEWTDDDDEDDDDDDDENDMPMLGNHKVTRPTPSKIDAEEPMLGNYQVTRAPTPTNEDSEEPQMTLGQAPAGSESGIPVDEEEAAHVGGSVEEGEEGGAAGEVGGEDEEKKEKEEDDVDKEEEKWSENDPQPSSPHPAPEPLPLGAAASNTSPAAVRQSSDGPNPDFPRERQRPRRPSNFFPGEENATKTHDEEVGELLAACFSEYAPLKLSESMWAPKLDENCQVTPQEAEASSSSSPPPAEDEAPPRMPNLGNGQVSPRGPSLSNNGPKPQPPPGAPTGPRGHVSREPAQGGLNEGANRQATPFGRQTTLGTGSRNDGWSPRGNTRRGYQPGQPGRAWTPEPPRTPPAAAANNNDASNQYPPATGRRGGWSGRGTPSGPARAPALNTPRAAPAATGDNNPAAGRRGGRGGRGPSTPQSGPARGARSAAMESFRRQNLGKKEG